MSEVPIGALSMFGGEVSGLRIEELRQEGWLPCDGQAYPIDDPDLQNLYQRIKKNYGGTETSFNVPDLRGRFIRGTDRGKGNDPDAGSRQPLQPGGNAGDAVGSVQPYATQRPSVNFSTDSQGEHQHIAKHLPTNYHNTPLSAWGGLGMSWTSDTENTSTDGNHTHKVAAGGDAESRPVNIYFHWLIKFRQAL
jgi:hypothetical protein